MKKIVLSVAVVFLFMQCSAQHVRLDYNNQLAGKAFSFCPTDTLLIIQNVLINRGNAIQLQVRGSKLKGKIAKLENSETVSFDLVKSFKNKPSSTDKLFISDDQSVSYSFSASPVAIVEKVASGNLPYTGIAYWDALAIFSFIQSPSYNADSLLHIINLYSSKNYTSLAACKSGNEFLKLALEDFNPQKHRNPDSDNQKNNELKDSFSLQSSGAASILGSLSGLDVTQYVQAFADFLRDRIKEELTIAYIDEFKKKIKNIKEFEYMLPNTINVFNTGDVFSVPTMGATYKTAFAEDMANLPENFERMVFSYEKYKDYRGREDFILYMAAYHAIKMSAERYHPADILRFIDTKYGYKVNDTATNKIRVALSLLNVLSKNLKNVDDNTWIDKAKVSVLNPFVVNVFLGLIYEQNRELFEKKFNVEGIQQSLRALLKSQSAERIFQFVSLANNIEQRINEYKEMIKEPGSAAEKREAVIAFFISNADDFFNLFDFGGNVISDYSNTPEFYRYKEIVKSTIEVAKGVKTNNIGQVGVNIIALIKQITEKTNDDATIQQLTQYISFITDMVNAESSEKIKQVLQTYAAPPRSYRAIRQSSRTVSLASFPGVYVGYESHSPSTSQQKGQGVFGITAPIGVSVGWGNNQKDATSFALFLSMVDIGAALTYRWSNDSTDLPQKVTLGQIFSPGLFGIVGLKNSPLAVKFGTQYLPQLRSIKQGNNVVEANAWHFSVALCVDIPVFIFSRKK